jgi:uncharacterized repeat protein (TIGR03809 family)
MPTTLGAPRLDEISRKWRSLADRRLLYFRELYRSGRWKHYYNEESFAARMRDVIKAARVWRDLAERTLAAQILAEQALAGQPSTERPSDRQARPRAKRMRPAA